MVVEPSLSNNDYRTEDFMAFSSHSAYHRENVAREPSANSNGPNPV